LEAGVTFPRPAALGDTATAPPGEHHVVQFYEDDAFLCETVARFLGEGLGAGEPVVVIATDAHRAAFCAALERNSVAVEHARACGQMHLYDARATLDEILVHGLPDRDRFRRIVGGALDAALAGREGRRIRAYGEMVDLLWRDGRRDAALRLEELWNDLARTHAFTLVCAYVMDNFLKESDAAQLARICDLHGHAHPTERYAVLESDAARLREVAKLQQRALALHNEVERRKKLEAELRSTQQRLQDFIETAVVPMHAVGPDGRVLWANQAELDLLGYARDEYVGRPAADFHVDGEAGAALEARLARGETLRDMPAQLRHKDGSVRDVLIDCNALVEAGQLVHSRCFLRDITAWLESQRTTHDQELIIRDMATRRVSEIRLRESEQRMRLFIDSIRDYAIFMLDVTGRVTTWNTGAQRIKGYRADEIIGRHFSVFYPEEDVKGGKCELELRGAAATGRFEDEGWRVRQDGSRFWANVVISAVRDHNGELVGFAKVTRDLTDRRHAEEERAALSAATAANRAKDEFLAMLGHELRNPLAPIVTALQLMKLRGDIRTTKEHVIIERQVQHVVRLVDDLLDVSRIAQGKIELKRVTVELAEVVAKAVEIASPLFEMRRHELSLDVPRQGMPLHADPLRLAQVITNLLTNAAKYTEVEGKIELAAWRDGHEVVLQIKDNGIGIRLSLLPHIFDLFVQGPRSADRSEGGLGIGLTLVRNLVQMHGGTVVALSEGPGLGSAFVVRLPAASPSAVTEQAALAETARRAARATTPRRVLVVDDNVDAAVLLSELLATVGHDTRAAHDGPQALELLDHFAPEVAVLDIGLPVMDGYELAMRIHDKLGASCRLIALTGYGQEHDRRRSVQSGFRAHLVKPVDPARVLKLIDGDDV
jgi:PAS domain S-box-containing protein